MFVMRVPSRYTLYPVTPEVPAHERTICDCETAVAVRFAGAGDDDPLLGAVVVETDICAGELGEEDAENVDVG